MKHLLTLFAMLVTSLAFGQESCPNLFDSNSNGAVDIEDFLAVLSLFSDVDSDSDGIWDSQDDCIDLEACNYAASPSEPCAFIDVLGECGGGCEGDGDSDGICDDEDDCVGVLDECGVCNGSGPTEVVIEDITILYDSVYAEQIDQWFVFEVGVDTTFGITCPPSVGSCETVTVEVLTDDFPGETDWILTGTSGPDVDSESYNWGQNGQLFTYNYCLEDGCYTFTITDTFGDGICCGQGEGYYNIYVGGALVATGGNYNYSESYTFCLGFGECGDPVSYQGYDYATVLIGEQCWFAENLRSENYENGEAIPSNLSDSEWENTSSGAVAVFGNGYCEEYSPDGDACDESWSLNEYGRLYNWYAVDDARGLCPSGWHVPTDGEWTELTDHLGGEGVPVVQMKTDYGWYSGGNGTNSSGFSGLPGGQRNNDGYFYNAGNFGYWWSSSPYGSSAWYRYLRYNAENVNRNNYTLQRGLSVRCVRDAQ